MPTPPTHTKPTSYRFSPRVLQVADQIADALGASRTTAFALGITMLSEHLGIKQLDAVAAVESIVRERGDDAPVTITVTKWDAATIEIAGRPAPDWTAWPMVVLSEGGEPLSSAGLYCRYEPLRVTFGLGEIAEPEIGSQLTVRAADLVDKVLLRSKQDDAMTPAQRRAELRAEFELRRQISDLLAKQGLDPIVGGDRADDEGAM